MCAQVIQPRGQLAKPAAARLCGPTIKRVEAIHGLSEVVKSVQRFGRGTEIPVTGLAASQYIRGNDMLHAALVSSEAENGVAVSNLQNSTRPSGCWNKIGRVLSESDSMQDVSFQLLMSKMKFLKLDSSALFRFDKIQFAWIAMKLSLIGTMDYSIPSINCKSNINLFCASHKAWTLLLHTFYFICNMSLVTILPYGSFV